ncbi:nucleotidyltransferase [Inconstantimicrobium porci]|uniref:tRNA(Met) cytidine acetate ligase n=1 Tax=Inconstantimicrobium porci TaxID=2652291 RepID=A0A7X2T0R8_9CLOT|nr:nucleotidyltransferase [Inconstantimicrobium porci]MSR90123.1 nucleotidyltransferase [Inconstantimicrobium porci]
MKITGIITEYNPFHNGHLFHLNSIKNQLESDAVVCVMSGNFVQRGLPAVLDKWSRAKMALLNGVDLVIELPSVYAVSSAEFFSFGAVSILNSTGVIDNICFGSESGNINTLNSIAHILVNESSEFKEQLRANLKEGLSFPKAREKALYDLLKNDKNAEDIISYITSPNNILGIEYCKSLKVINSSIKPCTIKRTGSGYNDSKALTSLASATSIRNLIKEDRYEKCISLMPEASYNVLEQSLSAGIQIPDVEDMFKYIKYKLLSDSSLISRIPDISEGLDYKILNEIRKASSYNELLFNIKSKRYTLTRVSRILCQIYLGFENYDIMSLRKTSPKYIRVLGFNETGQKILKMIKEKSNCTLITKMPKNDIDPMLQIDINSTNLYSLLTNSIKYGSDYLKKPVIVK